MKKIIFLLICCLSSAAYADLRLRPNNWAVPVIGSRLENLYSLDSKVFRSEQPDSEAFAELEQFGIKEILNLRQFHTDADEAKGTGLRLHQVKMNAGDITYEQILDALEIIKKSKGPILIHCWHGSDRTGIVSAAYRIVFQNRSKKDAIDELKNGGFGYHLKWYPNIVEMLNRLDVEYFRKELNTLH